MGALGHWLEAAGIPTSGISLIREHSERIRPPRALWVPFDLGRPLGAPRDKSFQTRVLLAALRLLEAPSGPLLVDFPDSAPEGDDELEGWACPIPVASATPATAAADLEQAFRDELARLRPWYDTSVAESGRTTLGISGLSLNEIGDFLPRFLDEALPPSPREGLGLPLALKRSAEDLRAAYGEAAVASPGVRPPTAEELSQWFWGETRAADLLRAIRDRLSASADRELALVAGRMLVSARR